MKQALLLLLLSAASIPAFAACSAGSGPPIGLTGASRSGVNSGTSINALTDSDRARMCDWVAQNNGGYGGELAPVKCQLNLGDAGPNGRSTEYTVSKKAPKSQASCIADLKKVPATCTATVGEVEECLTYLYENPCATEKNPPQCAALMTKSCMGGTTTTVVDENGSTTTTSSSSSQSGD
jgi:hypothetical protein